MNTQDDLLQRILDDKPPIPAQYEGLHRTLARRFDGERNKAQMTTTLWLLVALCAIWLGIFILATAGDTREMLFGLAALVAGFEMQVLLKLWYWVIDNKISVTKSVKETQLMIMETALQPGNGGTPPDAASFRMDDTGAGSLWERFSPVTMRRITAAVLVVVAAVGTLVLVGGLLPASPTAGASGWAQFGPLRVTEEDSWQFSSSDKMTASSLLLFSKPSEEGSLEMKLPYDDAVVTAVRPYLPYDGPPLPFTMKEKGAFTVALGTTKASGISVTWTVPLTSIERTPDGFRVPLRGLLPVYSYQLKGVVATDGFWEIKNDPASFQFNAFRAANASRPFTELGSCGIPLIKKGTSAQ